MAACKVADQRHHRSRLPPGFEDLLNDLVQSIIASQPLDLLDHIADYLEVLIDRRTLWGMQLRRGMQQSPKSIIKSETDKMGTRETHPCPNPHPCPTPPKRLNNATGNLPSPKPQNESNEDCKSVQAQAKPRPGTALGKPIRSNAKRTADVWTDDTVLASHLAQHEALRQVIKEIEDVNEKIISLEETARTTTQCTTKTRNTTQAKDLADKHSTLKRALDKMMLICTWIKSNEFSGGRSSEVRENPVQQTAERKRLVDGNQTLRGPLENQIDTLKGTMESIQAALADQRTRETSNILRQDNVLPDIHTMEQISPGSRGHRANTEFLDNIAKLSQWLQYMFQMLSRSEAQPQATAPQPTLLESQTSSSQNIVVLTETSETRQADNSSPSKQKKLSAETASSQAHGGTSSSIPGKQTKGSTAKHHRPADLTNETQNEAPAEVDGKKETRINLQYYVNETDKKKDTRVILVSTTSRESHTSRKAAHTKSKPVSLVGSQTSTTPGMILDATPDKIYQAAEADREQSKATSSLSPASTDTRRSSAPVPLRKPLKAVPIVVNSSETEVASLQITGKAESLEKKDQKEILTDDRARSQMTNNDSNISNIDSHSAFAKLNIPLSHDSIATSSYVNMFNTQSTSSVSEKSCPTKQTAAKPKEKQRARKHEICESSQPTVNINATQGASTKEFDNTFPQLPASGMSSQLSIRSQTNTITVKEFTSPSSEKIPHQPTKEYVLSNEIVSTSFIKSSSYAAANLTVQQGSTLMPTKEKSDNLQPNVSAKSLAQSSSHSAAKSSPQKGTTTKPGTETAENQLLNVHSSASSVKSSHSAAKPSSQKGDPAKPIPGTTPENLQPNAHSSTSSAKLSSHATEKSESKKGDPTTSSKELTPTTPQPNGATSASFTKTSSHSTTKSGTQKAIPTSAKPQNDGSNSQTMNDEKQTPRYVEYKNIFPQISAMQITPESSQSTLFKKPPSTPSAQSLNNGPEANILGGGVSSIERVKTQKAVVSQQQRTEDAKKTEPAKPVVSLTRAEDPVENAFSKLSDKSITIVMPKGNPDGAKQAEPKSKDSIKPEKTSFDSMSQNSTKFNKKSPIESVNPESSMENKASSEKPIQLSGTEINEPQLAAKSNNNNTKNTKQDHKAPTPVPVIVSTVHRNASELSLYSFQMSENPIKVKNESEKTEQMAI